MHPFTRTIIGLYSTPIATLDVRLNWVMGTVMCLLISCTHHVMLLSCYFSAGKHSKATWSHWLLTTLMSDSTDTSNWKWTYLIILWHAAFTYCICSYWNGEETTTPRRCSTPTLALCLACLLNYFLYTVPRSQSLSPQLRVTRSMHASDRASSGTQWQLSHSTGAAKPCLLVVPLFWNTRARLAGNGKMWRQLQWSTTHKREVNFYEEPQEEPFDYGDGALKGPIS